MAAPEEQLASLELAMRAEQGLATWMPPLIVAATAVTIVGGFYLGGPGLGMAMGAAAAGSILVLAARKPPLTSIVAPPAPDRRGHVLLVLGANLADTDAGEGVAELLRDGEARGREPPDVLVLAPCRPRFLERWTSDLTPGKERAQRGLVLSLAALAAAGVDARARLGEEDLVQAVEDELRSFPATEVVLVSAATRQGCADWKALRDLRLRLRAPLRLIAARHRPAASPAPSRSASSRPAVVRDKTNR